MTLTAMPPLKATDVLSDELVSRLVKADIIQILELAIVAREPDTYGCADCAAAITDMCWEHSQARYDVTWYEWLLTEVRHAESEMSIATALGLFSRRKPLFVP